MTLLLEQLTSRGFSRAKLAKLGRVFLDDSDGCERFSTEMSPLALQVALGASGFSVSGRAYAPPMKKGVGYDSKGRAHLTSTTPAPSHTGPSPELSQKEVSDFLRALDDTLDKHLGKFKGFRPGETELQRAARLGNL